MAHTSARRSTSTQCARGSAAMRRWSSVSSSVACSGGERGPHVQAAGAGRDAIIELEHLHQAPEGADRAGVDADVPTVAADEGAGDETGTGRGVLPDALGRQGGHRCIGLAPEHGVVGQRTVEQRGLDMPADAVGRPPVERGQRAEEGEVGRTEAGLGQTLEDRALRGDRPARPWCRPGRARGLRGRQRPAGDRRSRTR